MLLARRYPTRYDVDVASFSLALTDLVKLLLPKPHTALIACNEKTTLVRLNL